MYSAPPPPTVWPDGTKRYTSSTKEWEILDGGEWRPMTADDGPVPVGIDAVLESLKQINAKK